jgi:LPS-assembly protein
MIKFPAILALIICAAVFTTAVSAEDTGDWVIQKLSDVLPGQVMGDIQYDFANGTAFGTNGIYINYKEGEAELSADTASVNIKTGDVDADGHVRIESADLLWVGDHIHYNFKTKVMTSEQFRTGHLPIFAGGASVSGNSTNRVYVARQAYVTTDDFSDPEYEIRAATIKIIPGKSVQMWNAVAYLEGIPVFYFPYYERSLGPRANHFTTTPGYRSLYGAYLLNTYTWYFGDTADGKIHADERVLRGPGIGPEVNLHLGKWGNASVKYYYQYDNRPNYSTNAFPYYGNIPQNRQRFYLDWQATPATNLNLKALVNYQSDPLFLHDFFEGYYTQNPQPNTFVEANKHWENWSLDALATPRINSFFSQVERLPDVKLTGYRQQVLNTPVYYDSESSVGWYRAWDANATNGLYAGTNGWYAASAARADTYHQLTLPLTFFNWLNVAPRVGGRLTYYSSQNLTNGLPSSDVFREVFNTGVKVSFQASQLWPNATNSLLEVDGLRHIIEPSADYVFVPDPSTPPAQLPQFDSALPSLMLQPVDFPDYNSIDSIDTMNVVRFGLRNILQTKRADGLEDLVNWNMLLDWRLDPRPGQSQLNDLYSALSVRPRSWLTLESQLRYDLESGNLNLAFHQITFTPSDRWSWGLSHWYLRSGFVGPNENNFIASTFYFRLNDNWGLRFAHTFNAQTGTLQEQTYTIFRDLRSWTAALTFRAEAATGIPTDFTVAFALSLKAIPSTHVGEDALTSTHLVGE